MDLPSLRHFQEQKVFSDPIEALVGEAWVPAVYTDKGWTTADGANLLGDVQEWRDGKEEGQSEQSNVGVQGGDAQKRQARPRQRTKSQKPETGDSHCPI